MATTEMCFYCFDVLVKTLEGKAKYIIEPTFTNESFAIFVTWYKKHNSSSIDNHRLRGCIGTFYPQPLHRNLKQYALTSALKDSRFEPMTIKEVPLLKCGVSLLIDFEDANDVYDWEIGVHGIRIEFECPNTGREMGATYLPEVCSDQGWTKEECLQSLYQKAGFRGKLTKELLKQTKLERYKSSKKHVTYEEYIDFITDNKQSSKINGNHSIEEEDE